MNVSAIVVTRGDVELEPILDSIPEEWEVIVWDNGAKVVKRWPTAWKEETLGTVEDLAVYGRYAAIEYATNDWIYVQDDDVLHMTDGIEEIVRSHLPQGKLVIHDGPESYVTCNMPANFRHGFYQEHALVGFGACFHRDAPSRAFSRFGAMWPLVGQEDFFDRTCDIVFTGLTPRVLVDVDYEDLDWATADNRMWKQPTHVSERTRMLELVRQVRDAA